MTRRLRCDDLYRLAIPESPALAPDGSRIAYALSTVDRAADRVDTAIWSVPLSGAPAARLTAGPGDHAPAWAPDGSTLAFLRRDPAGGTRLCLLPTAGGDARELTRLPLDAGRPVWSPDGARLALSATVPAPGARPDGPIVTRRLGHRRDGVGLLHGRRRHLHVVDVRSGACQQLTHGDWDAGDPAWSPDGARLAFCAAVEPDADLRLTSAAYVIDSARPGPPERITAAAGMASAVAWTASGRELLVVGRDDVSAGNAGLLRVTLADGRRTDLFAGYDRNVMPGAPAYPGAWPAVTPDGRTALVCVREGGCTELVRVDLVDGMRTRLVTDQVVMGLSVGGGQAAVVVADAGSFGEVAVADVGSGELRRLTSHTRDSLPDVEFFAPESREFPAPDGTRVAGFLLRDPKLSGPGPLVVDIHGGPHNAWTPALDPMYLYHQALVAAGISVLLLNPRGSDGYGEVFRVATHGGWGVDDEQDILAPLEQLVEEGVADPARLGICGYSYGGFLTCYLTARTGRFAGAVTGGVVADLVSMAGTSDEARVLSLLELGAAPHEDVERVRPQSPIELVADVSTPTLILHGLEDQTCPVGQAEQWFTALRERGVPSELVLYPGGSHLFVVNGRPSHRVDYGERTVSWLARYLGAPRLAPLDGQHWQQQLDELAADHGVPGAVLGVLRLGDPDVYNWATGVLNIVTGVPVTTDSLFQIGSITKTWTATLIMQLVDEGRLDLDAPVTDVLPELQLGDPELAKQVTMRHLLTHSSGIDGDIFVDTGRGDDCLERYVAGLGDARTNHPLGQTFSYCNTGYAIAGRVIEVLTGQTWDTALTARLIEPLGLDHTCTLPEEALLHRAAVGHVGTPGESLKVAPTWVLPRSAGPAGLICSTAADLLAFARLHLTGGRGPDDAELVSARSIAAMQSHQADLPDVYTLGDSWGLGWIRYGWDDERLVGHDGGTIGQSAYLRLLPERGIAICLLTNGGHPHDLYRDLVGELVDELANVHMPDPLEPPVESPRIDAGRYVGTYERTSSRTEIVEQDGALRMRVTTTGPLAELVDDPSEEYPLHPVATDLFVFRQPGARTWDPVVFYRLPDGSPYLHYHARANPKAV